MTTPISAKRRVATAKFIFSAGEAKPGPPVGPVLAQFQLNIANLCRELNDQSSKLFAPGTPLATKIDIFEDKSYRIRIAGPHLPFLFSQLGLLPPDARVPRLTEVYDICRIYCFDRNVELTPALLSTVFGFMRSVPIRQISK